MTTRSYDSQASENFHDCVEYDEDEAAAARREQGIYTISTDVVMTQPLSSAALSNYSSSSAPQHFTFNGEAIEETPGCRGDCYMCWAACFEAFNCNKDAVRRQRSRYSEKPRSQTYCQVSAKSCCDSWLRLTCFCCLYGYDKVDTTRAQRLERQKSDRDKNFSS